MQFRNVLALGLLAAAIGNSAAISDKPDTPFKLATFETAGKARIGLVLDATVYDLAAANAYVIQKAHLPSMALPAEMRALIEQYGTAAPRLYQIANWLKTQTAKLPFAYDVKQVTIQAPIQY